MKLLIINQPTGNRGDESAHRGLIRSIAAKYPHADIQVAFFGESDDEITPMIVSGANVKYVRVNWKRGKQKIASIACRYSINSLVTTFIPAYRKYNELIKRADYIICAPGGICMGRFMNWNHIFWLNRARKYKKPVAYYSRSFGPFNEGNVYVDKFKKISIDLLKYFDFISIRDDKTMKIADKLGIEYIPSIDTAFIERPKVDLSNDLKQKIGDKYVVFVPNSLVWQPAYRNASVEKIDDFYRCLIELLSHRRPDHKIVMMPQLFGQKLINDHQYFQNLCLNSKFNQNIIVLDDSYSSDIQQTIIAGASLTIGARYHSIVFSINNQIPFISLSYEHKMFGLLSILDMGDRQVDLTKIGTKEFDKNQAIVKIANIMDKSVIDFAAVRKKANRIALDCFDKLLTNIAARVG